MGMSAIMGLPSYCSTNLVGTLPIFLTNSFKFLVLIKHFNVMQVFKMNRLQLLAFYPFSHGILVMIINWKTFSFLNKLSKNRKISKIFLFVLILLTATTNLLKQLIITY